MLRCELRQGRLILCINAIGIALYWALVLFQAFPISEKVPGYRNWFMSFAVADFWIFVCSVWALLQRTQVRLIPTVAAGSAMIFLAIYALAHGFMTGILTLLDADVFIEIFIKAYCVFAGAYLIRFSVRQLRSAQEKIA